MAADRERRSKPGRLDAKQRDEPRDAVLFLAHDEEVARRAAGRVQLWPQPRVVGLRFSRDTLAAVAVHYSNGRARRMDEREPG